MTTPSSKKRKAVSFAEGGDEQPHRGAKRAKFSQDIDFEDDGESKAERKAVDPSAGMHPRNIYKRSPPVRVADSLLVRVAG